jgi:hypothetical protein
MYVPLVETSSLEPQTLTEFITVFDTDWKERGLEEDWYKLRSTLKKEVGFSMKAQMDNLKRTDPENVAKWKTETSYMISGYALEYLSNNVIYPCKYRKSPENPDQMGDPQYGYTDIVDFISEKERGGSVKDAARKAKAFFDTDETPLGSLFVYLSPEGPTGLTTDKGEAITYPDSHAFVMVKTGSGKDFEVVNYTIKTDFDLKECRQVLFRLTGVLLPENASLEDYGRTLSTIKPGERLDIESPSDVLTILHDVRKGPFLYKEKPWDEAYGELENADSLYDFNGQVMKIKKEFEGFCDENPYLTKETYQKALAATIIRIADEMLPEDKESDSSMNVITNGTSDEKKNYGRVVKQMTQIAGCAGGGDDNAAQTDISITSVNTLGGKRAGVIEGGDCPEIKCPDCGWKPNSFELKEMENGTLKSCPGEKDGEPCGYSPG